jgi:glycosyltransferase involved in cell wall biosynthesis
MRIGFDLRPFLRQETGVGIYFKNLLFELARLDKANEYFLFSASWKDRFPREKIPPFDKMRFCDRRWPVKALNVLWYRFRRPTLDAVFKERLDLSHSPVPLILPTRGKKIVTVCDLFFLDFPGKADRDARRHFLKRTDDALHRADGIMAISDFTKNALGERFSLDPEKIKVTHLGLNPLFLENVDPAATEETRRLFGLPDEYLLFVGASEPRKNLPGLLDALSIVHRRAGKIPLVIAGRPGDDQGNVIARIQALHLEPSVRLLGYLPERDLRNLYRGATGLIFPSFCEGFGFPLLEAMASGLPVAASGGSALAEVGGDAALYFNPEDADDMAEKMIRLLTDSDLRQSLRTRGLERSRIFRWDKTARETLEFYRTVVGSR